MAAKHRQRPSEFQQHGVCVDLKYLVDAKSSWTATRTRAETRWLVSEILKQINEQAKLALAMCAHAKKATWPCSDEQFAVFLLLQMKKICTFAPLRTVMVQVERQQALHCWSETYRRNFSNHPTTKSRRNEVITPGLACQNLNKSDAKLCQGW